MIVCPLKYVVRLRYGDSLAVEARDESGSVPIYGSGGVHGIHSHANTASPVIVIGRKGSVGALHWSDEPVWVADTAYAVDKLLRSGSLRYMYYVLHAARLQDLSQDVGVPGLSRDAVHKLRVWLRPSDEQAAVAVFLDQETARITAALSAVSDAADRLGAIERAIADRVVADANTMPLKAVATIHSGVTLNESKAPHGAVDVPYLRVANVKAGWLDLDEIKQVPVPVAEVERLRLRDGDLLLTEGGDLDKLGRGALWESQLPLCVFQNHVFAVRPREGVVDARFLSWATRSSAARTYFESTASRITNIASTNKAKLGRWPVPNLPLDEQVRRLEVAEAAWVDARRAISAARQVHELLGEYRDSLIHEAVTGKLDVTQMSEQQMEERLHAAREGRLDEVTV